MADTSYAEDNISSGKRKRSPGNLVDVPIPLSLPRRPIGVSHCWTVPTPAEHPLPKKPRLPTPQEDRSPKVALERLPDALLQHIFSYVDPIGLARLSRTSKRVSTLLNPSLRLADIGQRQPHNVYAVRSQDSIWAASRRRHLPAMPKPLKGLSESAQFALTFASKCQFCQKVFPLLGSAQFDPWKAGPGNGNTRAIWPFRIRGCSACILQRICKYEQLVVATSSVLLPGLCFALFDQDMHFVPQALLHKGVPLGTSLQKYYFVPDIDSLEAELSEAQSLGSAAAEEWIKGLAKLGQSATSDAVRFENWELSGGLASARRILASFRNNHQVSSHASASISDIPQGFASANWLSRPSMLDNIGLVSALPPIPAYPPPPGIDHPLRITQAQSDTLSMGSQTSASSNKASKLSRERARIRGQKRAEIVNRCSKLDPPINKEMLNRLEAFDAAMKISMPLNENSWKTLKEHLLHQRHQVVLEDERKRAVRTEPEVGRFQLPARSDAHLLAHGDTDKKERLCQIAEEYIKQKWGYGGFVNYPNAPSFAAGVLLYTRNAYIEEQGQLYQARMARGLGHLTPGPLLLEDMKRVFEQTIRPRTEQIRKDLFLCPICPAEGSPKFFAFESVIQHYASKHTSAFSDGPKKVYWQSLWPVEQPFHLHPERVHTPEPSVTHTPTLTEAPLSVTSPSSAFTRTITSAGWRSPDTMSLLSSSTHTFLTSDRPTSMAELQTNNSRSGMYELQMKVLAAALEDSWKTLAEQAHITVSVQVFLAISSAVSMFRQKYSNYPSLELFRDAMIEDRELETLKSASGLLCAVCLRDENTSRNEPRQLRDLCEHFGYLHGNTRRPEKKLEWHHEMLALPEPRAIQDALASVELSQQFRALLQEALQTAMIQRINRGKTPVEPEPRRRTITDTRGVIDVPRDQAAPYYNHFRDQDMHRVQPHVRYQEVYPTGERASLAVTYGDSSIPGDTSSTSSRTIVDDRRRQPALHYEPRSISTTTWLREGDSLHTTDYRQLRHHPVPSSEEDDVEMTSGQAMTRTNTVRSYHSRGRKDEADDFLSKIDAHLDTEMAESGAAQAQSTHPSRTASTTISHSASLSVYQDHAQLSDRDAREPTFAAGRHNRPRFIELYHDGDPSSIASRTTYHQESSPPHTYHHHGYDRPVHADSQSYSQPVRYLHVNPIYDPATGRYYVEENPAVTYVPIDEPSPQFYDAPRERSYARAHSDDARTFPGR